KRDLPHIPYVQTREAFDCCVRIGERLMDLHVNYEQQEEYTPFDWKENPAVPRNCSVKQMHLIADKTKIVVNERLTLTGVPPACFHYRLGNRSALEWVLDRYQIKTDEASKIVNDPNRRENEQYIARLVRRVVTVSVETVRLVGELEQQIKMPFILM